MIRLRVYCLTDAAVVQMCRMLENLGTSSTHEHRTVECTFEKDDDPLVAPIVTAVAYELSTENTEINSFQVLKVGGKKLTQLLGSIFGDPSRN